jgi:amidase/aspartyl-tRNA(Asn)/glutamyl-tRNA(Gln) amidotransferase subunit A
VNGDHYLGAASSAAAISGYPHITVPMGYVHGLPVGLSLFSGKLQEGILIETAFGYEQATKHRVPPELY